MGKVIADLASSAASATFSVENATSSVDYVLSKTDGAAGEYLKTDGSGNLSFGAIAAAETNNPHFYAYLSSAMIGLTDNTWTKINCDTVVSQTGSTYDNSTNYRWTPGVIGTYYILSQIEISHNGADDYNLDSQMAIYKNGVEEINCRIWKSAVSQNNTVAGVNSAMMVLNATDYLEFYGKFDTYSGSWNVNGTSKQQTHFMGYRMII